MNVGALHNLALLVERGGRLEEALAYAEQALALQPEKEDTLSLKERIIGRIEQRKRDALRQQELAEQRQRELENLIHTAPERWTKVDHYKRRILGTLAALKTFEGFRELAKLVDMEERVLRGHWSKLVELGMVIEEENGPQVNPYILDLVKRERAHAVVTRIAYLSRARARLRWIWGRLFVFEVVSSEYSMARRIAQWKKQAHGLSVFALLPIG
jgi:hypothetical protein